MKFIVREKDREYEFLLTPGLCVIGRDPTCDLTLDSKEVSRRHLACTVTDKEVAVKDLGSRNGIQVGGATVKSAVLKDGDVVKVGNMQLVLRAGPVTEEALPVLEPVDEEEEAAAEPAVVSPQPGTEPVEPTVEDEEATPADGTLLPQKVERGVGPRLAERDGRWYVVDPATGKEVEIAPVAGAQARRRSLLSTTKGRLMVGGLAGVVVVLLILAVASALLGEKADQTAARVSGGEYDRLIEAALDALDEGDVAMATSAAERAYAGVPESNREPARILRELVALWEPWREDFFSHWVKVDGSLKDLYYCSPSKKTQEFVKKHRDEIHKELERSQLAHEAKQAYEGGDYETAMDRLMEIPPDSPVRKRDAEFIEEAHDALFRYLTDQMRSAEAKQDWAAALACAGKLGSYFAEHKEKAEQETRRYTKSMREAQHVSDAKSAMARKQFEEANRHLDAIPEGSPYYREAARLLERAKEGEQYAETLALYAGGKGTEALQKLASQQTAAARSLERQIESVLDVYNAAREAQQNKRLVEAEQLWLDLAKLETDGDNYYRKEALREIAGMKRRRQGYAREIAAEAGRLYRTEEFERARQLYENAVAMDPDGEVGDDALRRMDEQGRNDYRHGLNLIDNDPQEALQRFTRACRLLRPDDKYYTWARDKKRSLERRLGVH